MPYIKIKYINVIVENANIDNHELKIKIGFALNDLLEDELRLQIMSGE
ncbi:MAG: hypothetical protein ISS28_05165 [Candidatus Cloacimonetes bacterium]|nr:hypothetical protein [Actinomycetota bacterium]MBL7086471.1 hypothetical protein [Candidatus Cloacimonadota bacterium]